VAVGTASVPTGYKMAIDGKLITEEVKVQVSGNWPDYVFKEDYPLLSLEEIQKHIQEKGHLPNMPSAKEVEANGVELGEMNKLLLEKIEELTLYILEQQKEINKLKAKKIEELTLYILEQEKRLKDSEAQNRKIESLEKDIKLLKQKFNMNNKN